MRVTNNMITSNTKSNINANKVLVDKYNTQMTTQKKINKPSDDPVIAIRSLRMQTSLSHIDQYLNKHFGCQFLAECDGYGAGKYENNPDGCPLIMCQRGNGYLKRR